MLKKIALVMSLVGSVVLWGCSSDDESLVDGGSKEKDKGTTVTDGGTTTEDAGTTTEGGNIIDGNGPKETTCLGIMLCTIGCPPGDGICLNDCTTKGSKEAQGLYNAFMSCAAIALGGDCVTYCTDTSKPECQQCVFTACAKESDACQDVLNNAVGEGAGDACNKEMPCNPGMNCITYKGSELGYCIAECKNVWGECGEEPEGTFARCDFPVNDDKGGQYFVCGFMCVYPVRGQQFNCPSTMICSTEEDPPGTGTHWCIPGVPTDGGVPIADAASSD
ncbi:MAG: hypothetical protein V1754_00405 [Pseudomonadota bacterium]